jgi:hypothetical protein
MGSQGDCTRILSSDESALLHAETIRAASWADFLRAEIGDRVCSCVFPRQKKTWLSKKKRCASPAWNRGSKWIEENGSTLNYQRKGSHQVSEHIE